jgi:hypothetical protein
VVHTLAEGDTVVAVADQNSGGVWIDYGVDTDITFRPMITNDLKGQNIQRLGVQFDNQSRSYLWAGTVPRDDKDPGQGAFHWELLSGGKDPAEGWVACQTGWEGGACMKFAFHDTVVLAATNRSGILFWDTSKEEKSWKKYIATLADSGLTIRRTTPRGEIELEPISGLVTSRDGKFILASGEHGIVRTTYQADAAPGKERLPFESVSAKEFTDQAVTLPESWLFVSGEHSIEVVPEDEAI